MAKKEELEKIIACKNALESLSANQRLITQAIDSIETLLHNTTDGPVIGPDLSSFVYKGYDCELCSCTSVSRKDQILGLTEENFLKRFPFGVFSDKYVCFIYGHRDDNGRTKEECEDPDNWLPKQYLVPEAWLYGAGDDLEFGKHVDPYILEKIDAFLEENNDI